MSWLWMMGLLWAGFNAALVLVLWWRFVSENRREEALIAELYEDMESCGPHWFVEAIAQIERHGDA
jgi:hypothetical protein